MDSTREKAKEGISQAITVGNVRVVSFQRGRIREEREILKALEEVGKYVECHHNLRLLLNLENIEYLTSAGLGTLVGILKKVRRSNGELKLCCLQAPIRELFEVMRLTRIFDIFETEEAAHKAFGKAG